jgi:hypothetical protein
MDIAAFGESIGEHRYSFQSMIAEALKNMIRMIAISPPAL